MLNETGVILLMLLSIAILVLFCDFKKTEPFSKKCNKKLRKINNMEEIIDDVISWDDYNTDVRKQRINPNFLDVQFHNDYRDVITAFNNIVPDKHQIFNLANVPLQYSEPPKEEVRQLIKDFIDVANENMQNQVPSHRNKNSGWDEAIPDPNMQSGWDKVQKSLGLAPTLYHAPKVKNGKLVHVETLQVQKYETEDEIKYACTFILQKQNTEDQIIIKINILQDKRPLRDENNFHVNSKISLRVIIEDISIVGYLSDKGNDARLTFDGDKEKFYDYDRLEHNNLLDPKDIQKTLLTKYQQRTEEMQQRNALLDEEGQAFHRTLPNLYDFSNIKDTRTIFDDMNSKKVFY